MLSDPASLSWHCTRWSRPSPELLAEGGIPGAGFREDLSQQLLRLLRLLDEPTTRRYWRRWSNTLLAPDLTRRQSRGDGDDGLQPYPGRTLDPQSTTPRFQILHPGWGLTASGITEAPSSSAGPAPRGCSPPERRRELGQRSRLQPPSQFSAAGSAHPGRGSACELTPGILRRPTQGQFVSHWKMGSYPSVPSPRSRVRLIAVPPSGFTVAGAMKEPGIAGRHRHLPGSPAGRLPDYIILGGQGPGGIAYTLEAQENP